jgi:hypothetical protein
MLQIRFGYGGGVVLSKQICLLFRGIVGFKALSLLHEHRMLMFHAMCKWHLGDQTQSDRVAQQVDTLHHVERALIGQAAILH